MDEHILWQAAHLLPETPFRASTGHRHATWAWTWHSRPELYIQPQTTAEIQKVVSLARRCRRHIVTVGAGHSPSDLTCTSSWLVNLDHYNRILSVDPESGRITMEAGIRLFQLQEQLGRLGLAMPNAGSITEQSIAGAIATGTHGSSLRHGLLSDNVLALKLVLADGCVKSCSRTENTDLFRAALVSLGALGIIIEVTFQAIPDFKVEWQQSLVDLSWILERWRAGLWTEAEFVRIWWMPYMKKCIYWRADKTDLEIQRPAKRGLLGGRVGNHIYQMALYIANWIPAITPWIERIVGRVQYGSSESSSQKGVQWAREALQMDCLYSQFVNEWALPLDRGPEALMRLSAWLHGDQATSRLPYSNQGIYVHAPVEVRVSDGSSSEKATPRTRAFLDPTEQDQPTLYLNATLYRPYHSDPPCVARYYQAFEHLMRELGGRPHWAKNFTSMDVNSMYPETFDRWLQIRDDVDPMGMFFGDWHRRNLLGGIKNAQNFPSSSFSGADPSGLDGSGMSTPTPAATAAAAAASEKLLQNTRLPMALEERRWATGRHRSRGGRSFFGEIVTTVGSTSPPVSEGSSFEMMDHGDAEMSFMLDSKLVADD